MMEDQIEGLNKDELLLLKVLYILSGGVPGTPVDLNKAKYFYETYTPEDVDAAMLHVYHMGDN